MSIQAALYHHSMYRYDRPVVMSPQIIRLRPAPHTRTPILSYSLRVTPDPNFINWQQDPHGNWLARVVFPDKISEFNVVVDLVADLAVINPFDFFVEPSAEEFPFTYEPALATDLAPYRRPAPAGPLLSRWLEELGALPRQTVDLLVALNHRLQQQTRYVIRLEAGIQTPEQTLELGSGSCRDSAWLLVQILRRLGFAARFVSGYLLQLKPDVKPLEGPVGASADFTDLHAWAEAYVPGAGWIGLDATSGLLAGEGHIPLCATPEPGSAAPISGRLEPCEVTFEHTMRVERVRETPRVTKPYSEEQWQRIDALGEAVDRRLRAGDVRLTMGGEPTFISADDMQGEEWSVAAVGPTKERLSRQLIERLRDRLAPGGLVTYGQGKWYPGESLPRWAYSLYWRNDQRPLWTTQPPERALTPSRAMARKLLLGIAQRLEVDPANVLPAYEDPLYYLHKERRLPNNVTVVDSRLKDPEARARLTAIFEQGLDEPRGFVLPVQRWMTRARPTWFSEFWRVRGGRLFLIPGDSPVGLRLPLESLPWIPPLLQPSAAPADPTRPLDPLPSPDSRRQPYLQTRGAARDDRSQQKGADARDPRSNEPPYPAANVRTALAAEVREGQVNVFLPPVSSTEEFLDLVSAVEDAAAELQIPVRLEGYAPPSDGRLNLIKVTPDPGVIEVNIAPAHSWAELRDNAIVLYEEAREARLTTEKFLIDGRAVGTGGGNHVVVGAAHPSDSPFLRRPDLLGSMLRYWQNHPCLSYLFAGLFIGPTSQAPRVDEGGAEALYELEIALLQIPREGMAPPPWLVDRLFRHLLVDLAGNTHRSEFCIDKLYAPESATGRLGLLELRGFEMPPHVRMSLVQQLLVRAFIAWFWESPYQRPLVRWGTALHDRFMLPHHLSSDLDGVLAELKAAGFAFEKAWFDPHLEFRCPVYGEFSYGDLGVEIRQALEPWPVMGEEPGAGGTTRFVDSSLERLQVRVTGLSAERFWIACNGRALPLAPTGTFGEAVAGVRFRAWQPASCLHPTIGVHSPLVFDVYDRWNQRALAGCTYHVAHPAGRNYDTFPVNAYEAEARRLARFTVTGHTPGSYQAVAPQVNPEYPCTLDLRRG